LDALIVISEPGYFNLRPFLENVPEIRILVGINVDDLSAGSTTQRTYLEKQLIKPKKSI
jgi:hypothetical protein